MRISKLKIMILQRKESFLLRKEFENLVSLYKVDAVDMDELFLVFLEIYRQEEEALEVVRNRCTNNQLVRMDIKRNIVFREFVDGVKSSGNCLVEDIQQASFRLKVLLERYGNITRRSCYKKTTCFHNLIQDISNLYFADVDTMGLMPWILKLDYMNKAVDLLSKMHYDKVVAKTGFKMKQVRQQIDAAYQYETDQLNTLIKLKVAIEFKGLVRCMDA